MQLLGLGALREKGVKTLNAQKSLAHETYCGTPVTLRRAADLVTPPDLVRFLGWKSHGQTPAVLLKGVSGRLTGEAVMLAGAVTLPVYGQRRVCSLLMLPRARAVAAVIPAGDSISTLASYVDQAKAELYIIAWALLGSCAPYRSNRAASSSLPLTRCQATTTRSAVQRNFVCRLNPLSRSTQRPRPIGTFVFVEQAKDAQPASNVDNSAPQFRAVPLSVAHSIHEVTSQVANGTERTPLSAVASGAASQQQSTAWEPKRSQHRNVLVRRSLPPNQHLD
ncbi:hypothetical protein BM1_05233 [Bipolaris maydis]|nr:hypothetical protein BM1_05233 [Bipolaris maydis]